MNLAVYKLAFEDSPPYSSLVREAPSQVEVLYSRLADPRWVDVALARLKEIDDVIDRRQRLRQRRTSGGQTDEERARKATQAKAKAEAKRKEKADTKAAGRGKPQG